MTRREQLATLLERELNQPLYVRFMAIYLEGVALAMAAEFQAV